MRVVSGQLLVVMSGVFLGVGSAEEVVVSSDGREVLLGDSGSWEYVDKSAEIEELWQINQRVKGALAEYVHPRTKIFTWFPRRFRIPVEREIPYRPEYDDILEGLYKMNQQWRCDKFYNVLAVKLGKEPADNILWLIRHWEDWNKYAKDRSGKEHLYE